MATDLRDRLSDLASHTPPATPPADLWQRGVRRRRRERAGTAVLALLLVLLVGAGGLAWKADRRVEPAAPHGRVTFPDRFYAPSPWLPTFHGPPGPLLAIIPAEHKTLLHTRQGLVGITAAGNDYGFLPLPSESLLAGSAAATPLALSPSGTRVAFWVTGPTTGRPNTEMVSGVTVTGVGTYDAVTGVTRVQQVPSTHGLHPSLLLWTDDSTLVFGYGRIANDGSGGSSHATYDGTYRWSAGAAAPVELPPTAVPAYPDNASSTVAQGRLLTEGYHRRWWLVDPERPAAVTRIPVADSAGMPVLSDDLRDLAGLKQTTTDYGYYPLLSATVPAAASGRAVTFHRVPTGAQWYATVGWSSPGHVVAMRRLPGVDLVKPGQVMAELDTVDVANGTYTRLAGVETQANVADPGSRLLATAYLDAPIVHAAPPPRPWSERWWLLIGGVALVVVVVLWRRRARRP